MAEEGLHDLLRGVVVPWRQSPPPPAPAEPLGSAELPIATVVMPGLDRAAIEAAPPAARRAFRRFEESWSRGRGTRRDFYDLVRLLHRAGCPAEAEYFLRSNLLISADDAQPLSVDDGGLDLYVELFGTARHEEFAAAIAAFAVQFAAPLRGGAGSGFEVGYHTAPQVAYFAKYRMRNEPCYVRFEYGKRDTIEAWLECRTDEDQLLVLRWANPAWEIIGKGMVTKVHDGDSAAPVAAPDSPRDRRFEEL